jgi:aminoglycoside phosphotransferase (APT) family kinase protein
MENSEPPLYAIQSLVERLRLGVAPAVERVPEGVSTYVYRVRYRAARFYLRILPECGATFAPEVRVLGLLRERGVPVPEVIYYEPRDATLGRSVMVTTEIPGHSLAAGSLATVTKHVLVEAGRALATINSIPVVGFGWIKRDHDTGIQITAEHAAYRAFALEHLGADLAILGANVLTGEEVATIRGLMARYDPWLDVEHARLAHGDFDVTPIMQQHGRFTGIIDFGEIRGGDQWYDLAHFRMHDGETLPTLGLPWLLEGYADVTPLPVDYAQRISFASLLIATRALARRLAKIGRDFPNNQGAVSIRRDLALLRA